MALERRNGNLFALLMKKIVYSISKLRYNRKYMISFGNKLRIGGKSDGSCWEVVFGKQILLMVSLPDSRRFRDGVM